jgi:tRNA 5-methylaminomethyl-2-thiouridine biosynthesis bifunctional protein
MVTRRTTAWEGIALAPIEAAELRESDTKFSIPISANFDDVYFNAADGIGETDYVFLQQNELERRFAEADRFTIAELGFGTGLSFLSTVALWEKVARPDAHLHFLSFEKHPISRSELEKIHSNWPCFSIAADELRKKLPELTPGFHRICFSDPKVSLTLAYGDAQQLLPLQDTTIDAWFLDGFSPSKNPELWSESIATEVARCSRQGTTFSTFSAAGHVRRSLSSLGFDVEKVKGFGNKRELLRGVFRDADSSRRAPPRGAKKRVCIVGAGLAGVLSARSLARRGYEVTLVDKARDICQGASGNSAATLMPPVYSQHHALHRFYLAGFQYTRNHLLSLVEEGESGVIRGHGVIKVPNTKQEIKLRAAIGEAGIPDSLVCGMTSEEASNLLGFEPRGDVLFFPQALCYQPYAYCAAVLKKLGDSGRLVFETEVAEINRTSDVWQLGGVNGELIAESETIVLANAFACESIEQTSWMRLEKVRGQIASIPTSSVAAKPKVSFFDKIYLLPESDESFVLGATWDHNDFREEQDQEQHQELVSHLERAMGMRLSQTLPTINGRVSFRSSTPDRMPYVGPMFAGENDDNRGLYLNIGHGSRGGAACGLSAEILAAYIENEVFPCDSDVIRTLSPRRVSSIS